MADPADYSGIKTGLLAQSITLLSRSAILRYLFALAMVGLAVLLRSLLTVAVGRGLPTYITFYPAVMFAALLAGFWPGMLATVLSALYAMIWLVPPYGVLTISSPVDVIGVGLFCGMGVLTCWLAFSYRRTREQALAYEQAIRLEAESARARFEGVLESAPDSIIMVNAVGMITLVNSQLERLTGYQRAEVLGKPVELLVPDRVGDTHLRHRDDYMADPHTRPMGVGLELFIRGHDGREIPVEISLSPFSSPEGTLVIAVIRDITARKAADAEITRLNTALRHNVEQLTVANKELEAFSYSVSHDLRAPLRGIDGFSRVLAEQYPDRLDERGCDYLARVRHAAQRMNLLIEDMLKLSRIGRAEMRRDTVNLSDLASSVISDLRQRDPEREVDVAIQPDLLVTGDCGLLRIVLENLLGNAWKFTGKTADARIAVGSSSREGESLVFVRDNGTGFDMAYAEKLFIPFQRLHTEEEFPGTGIGLAIVSRIIIRHGGRVWAEAKEGEGTTIFFTLGEEVSHD